MGESQHKLDYRSPRVKGPLPDVVFLLGWMAVFVGIYLAACGLLFLLFGRLETLFLALP